MPRVDKLLKRFEEVFAEKNYYEAHQIARAAYSRWSEHSDYAELINFLYKTSLDFSKVKELTISLDLADLYAKSLLKYKKALDDETVAQIEKILNALSQLIQPDEDGKEFKNRLLPLINQLYNWSSRQQEGSRLNQVLESVLTDNGQEDFVKALQKKYKKGAPSKPKEQKEIDLD